jgi:nicotinate-nucleotide adenylyltransferase
MGLSGILPEEFARQFIYDEAADGYRGPSGHLIYFRQVTFLDISSSDIRARVKNGKSITYLTPDSVRHYIKKNKLYSTE